MLFTLLYLTALFVALTPNILVKFPKKGSVLTRAVVHALLFVVVYHLLNMFVFPLSEGYQLLPRRRGEEVAQQATARRRGEEEVVVARREEQPAEVARATMDRATMDRPATERRAADRTLESVLPMGMAGSRILDMFQRTIDVTTRRY